MNDVLNSFIDDDGFCVSNIRDTERGFGPCRCRKVTGERKKNIIRRDPRGASPTERPDHEHQGQTDN